MPTHTNSRMTYTKRLNMRMLLWKIMPKMPKEIWNTDVLGGFVKYGNREQTITKRLNIIIFVKLERLNYYYIREIGKIKLLYS